MLQDLRNLQAAHWVWSLLWFAVVIGLFSMILLQVIKDLLPWRTWFQSGWMRLWLKEGASRFLLIRSQISKWPPDVANSPFPLEDPFRAFDENLKNRKTLNDEFGDAPQVQYTEKYGRRKKREGTIEWSPEEVALQDLADLATAGSKRALLELPIEQLCGQMIAATQHALDHARYHVVLIACLSQMKDPVDLAILLETMEPPSTAGMTEPAEAPIKEAYARKVAVYSAARQRVTNRIQRSIDGFQITVGNRWKSLLQWLSIAISTIVASVSIYIETQSNGNPVAWIPLIASALVVGLLAGFVAPVLRDVLALLTQPRK